MIKPRNITWDNLRDVPDITIPDAQKPFVQSIPKFLAQSYVNLKEGYEDTSLALYDERALIGYAKLVFVPAGEAFYAMPHDSLMIDALIIDGSYQGKGYGPSALEALMEYAKTSMNHGGMPVSLAIFDDNIRAVALVETQGFSHLKKHYKKRSMSIHTKTDV